MLAPARQLRPLRLGAWRAAAGAAAEPPPSSRQWFGRLRRTGEADHGGDGGTDATQRSAASKPALAQSAYELQAHELGPFARRLAQRWSVAGGDPLELEKAWDAVAFQAHGLAEQLAPKDACTVLVALASGRALARHEGTTQALLDVLRKRGVGALGPRKVVTLWRCLDRVDSAAASRYAEPAVAEFFRGELARAVPPVPKVGPAAVDADEPQAAAPGSQGPQGTAAPTPRPPRGSDAEWQRVHALLEASGCCEADLKPVWEQLQAVTIADPGAVRALTVEGLIAAARAAALAPQRAGVASPAAEFARRLCQRLVEQARWMDGWAASHAVAAIAALAGQPGRCYDPLRPTLLERCGLEPSRKASRSLSGNELARLSEAERVAAALATLEVHDKDMRARIATWLLRPLPPLRFARLATHLARAGLGGDDAKIARHVRARARSSELADAVGIDGVSALLRDYADSDI